MESKRLRVLFISSWYPSKEKPLLGIFVKRHAAALAGVCDVDVLQVCWGNDDHIEEVNEDAVYTLRVYKKTAKGIFKLLRYNAAWKKAIKVYETKRGRPDIINANIIYPVSIIASRLKKKWKIPYVITEHWTGYFPEDGRYGGSIMKLIARKAVKKAGAVVTDSNRLKKRMLELGLTNNYYSIPNVVDGELFKIRGDKKTQPFNFIHVSALYDAQKNVSGIIKAFTELHKQLPTISLTIVGGGEALEGLKLQVKELNLQDSITFTGSKVGTQLVDLYNDANAFILFSNYENLPCVMLEAQCCGLPVIGTNVGDVPEYINERNGIVIKAGDEAALAEAMKQIIEGYNKYNSTEIRNAVLNKVSPQVIASQFMQVFESVLNK
jgi:glycosyltransferase involved in cell wall biosynthesis